MDDDRAALEALTRALRDHVRWEVELGAFGSTPAPPRPETAAPPAPAPTTRAPSFAHAPTARAPSFAPAPASRAPAPAPSPPAAAASGRAVSSLSPDAPSASGSLSPDAPSASGSLSPDAPSASGSLSPAAPSAFSSLSPAAPSAFSSLSPDAPSASGSLSPERGEGWGEGLAGSPPVRRSRPERLSMLATLDEQVRGCTRCRLHEGRTNTVFGVGNPEARLCFVGEGPGRDEDLRGEPFVGRAGQLLDRMIQAMGLSRDDVYICNVVKCRPPENRTPLPDEAATCGPFLDRQLDVVAPEAIVALGACAARQLLATTLPMGRLRGRFHEYRGIPVMPTYHPAYLLRNEEAKRPVWEDLQQVMTRLGLTRQKPAR